MDWKTERRVGRERLDRHSVVWEVRRTAFSTGIARRGPATRGPATGDNVLYFVHHMEQVGAVVFLTLAVV